MENAYIPSSMLAECTGYKLARYEEHVICQAISQPKPKKNNKRQV